MGEQGKGSNAASGASLEEMSTSEILVKVYQEIERDFQTPESIARTTPDSFSGAKDSEAQVSGYLGLGFEWGGALMLRLCDIMNLTFLIDLVPGLSSTEKDA